MELVLTHLTQRRCYFLTLNFSKMSKQEKRPVQSKNEQTITKLLKVIKSFFQGKPVTAAPVYTHPTYLEQQKRKCVTINVNELSPEARQEFNKVFDPIFDRVFSKVQFSKS